MSQPNLEDTTRSLRKRKVVQSTSTTDVGTSKKKAVITKAKSPAERAAAAREKAPRQERSAKKINQIPTLPHWEKDTRVFVFGSGEQAELGLGPDMLVRKKPMPLTVLDDEKIVYIATGGQHCVAVTQEGKLWSWGASDAFNIGRITTENAGEYKTLLQKEGRELDVKESDITTEWVPGRVLEAHLDNLRVVKAACGDTVTIVLTELGTVYQCGLFRGGEGKIANSQTTIFTLISELEPYTITDIACGNNHVLALSSSGLVFSWGNDEQSQSGRRGSERHTSQQKRLLSGVRPERVPISGIKKIGCGGYHSFAIDEQARLWSWGLNTFGQTCLNFPLKRYVSPPQLVESFVEYKVHAAMGGEHFSLVLVERNDEGYDMWTCGRSDVGQLGLSEKLREPVEEKNESTKKSAVITPMCLPYPRPVISASTGTEHCIALDTKGQAWCWGFGDLYQLGTSSEDNQTEPVLLTGQKLDGWIGKQVAAAGGHTMFLGEKV